MILRTVCLCLAALVVSGPAWADSCADSAGAARAAKLVDQCLQVSTASHPPCNASNACALMINEIRRGCAGLGDDAPRFCERY